MRVAAIDPGMRRTGVAVSDATGLIATPYRVLRGTSMRTQWPDLIALLRALRDDDDGLATVVVGVPLRLDGTATDMTEQARGLADRLTRTLGEVVVVTRDERLTSVEAEQRLSLHERDWRKRKDRLDAAAAAVLLQDYLDEVGRERKGKGERRKEKEE